MPCNVFENLRGPARFQFHVRGESKESGPRRPGFDFIPEGWRLPLDAEWNDGMVEEWNIGYEKPMMPGL